MGGAGEGSWYRRGIADPVLSLEIRLRDPDPNEVGILYCCKSATQLPARHSNSQLERPRTLINSAQVEEAGLVYPYTYRDSIPWWSIGQARCYHCVNKRGDLFPRLLGHRLGMAAKLLHERIYSMLTVKGLP